MAIRPIDEYPGNVDPVDADYPDGKARDVTSPGAGDGTPLQAKWLNDWYGFQQAVLTAAGITPSGTPETAQASQILDGINAIRDAQLGGTSVRVELGGDFNAGQDIVLNKNGPMVTLTAATVLSHASTASPTSAAGVIPAAYRPSALIRTTYYMQMSGTPSGSAEAAILDVNPDGSVELVYFNIETYTTITGTSSRSAPSVNYVIATDVL